MSDPIEQVLRLVAEGRLTAEEAAPILDALEAKAGSRSGYSGADAGGHASGGAAAVGHDQRARFARIEVFENGRTAVNLRIPLSLGQLAFGAIPGLAGPYASQINQAIAGGAHGSVLDVVDEDGDGVRVVLE
jgi:hypothetical protein